MKNKEKKVEKTAKSQRKIDKKWLTIIGLCLLIVIILFLLFFLIFQNHRINKSTDIVVGGYNQVITVKSISEVKMNKELYSGKYLRIDLEIENKKAIDSVTALHQFSLVDDNNNLISNCYHDSILPDNQFENIFPNTIMANKVTKGYLYCPIDEFKTGKLKITVITGGRIDDDNNVTYKYGDYYIELK